MDRSAFVDFNHFSEISVQITDFLDTSVSPADFISVVIDGQRIGQLQRRFDEFDPVGAVSAGSFDFGIVAIPIAPEQETEIQ